MIRHMLLFSFRDEVGQDERRDLLDGLRELPSHFSRMRDFELGRNESRRDATFEFGMTVAFDSFADLESYLDSERHERFVTERFRPLIRARAIVSFEIT